MSFSLDCDVGYLKTIPCILRISCLLSGINGLLCIIFSYVHLHNFRAVFYITVMTLGACSSISVLLARLFRLRQLTWYPQRTAVFETYLNGVLALLYFTASYVTITLDVTTYQVAAYFGYLAFSFSGFGCYLAYRLSRQCDVATQTQNV